jgi:hypothetical protein
MRWRAGALFAVTAALGVAGPIAGCGAEEDLTAGLSAEQILEESASAANEVRFYHPEITLSVDLEGQPAAGGLGALAQGPITITAEGPVRRPIVEEGPAFSFDLTATLGPLTIPGNLTKVGDGVYLSLAGQDFTLGLPPEQAAEVRLPPQPALFVASPQIVGKEAVNGVETLHLRGTVDTDAVADYLLGVLRGAPALLGGGEAPTDEEGARIREQLRSATRESQVDLWIGTQDLLPYRVGAEIRLEGAVDLLPGITGATLEVTADVGGFDEEAEIVAPANPKPFDLESILPGLGS